MLSLVDNHCIDDDYNCDEDHDDDDHHHHHGDDDDVFVVVVLLLLVLKLVLKILAIFFPFKARKKVAI